MVTMLLSGGLMLIIATIVCAVLVVVMLVSQCLWSLGRLHWPTCCLRRTAEAADFPVVPSTRELW